jgi:hypothetical protein
MEESYFRHRQRESCVGTRRQDLQFILFRKLLLWLDLI